MPKYRIQASVKASGLQYYTIEADSPEQAEERFDEGEGVFEDEDLSVDDIVDIDIEEIE